MKKDDILATLEKAINENKTGSVEEIEDGLVFHTLLSDVVYQDGQITEYKKDVKEQVKNWTDCKKWLAKAEEDLELRIKSIEKMYKKSIHPVFNVEEMLQACVCLSESILNFWGILGETLPLTIKGDDVWYYDMYLGDIYTLIPYDELAIRIQVAKNHEITDIVKEDGFYLWKTTIANEVEKEEDLFSGFYTLPTDIKGETYEAAENYLKKLKEELNIKILAYKRNK
jgi:hypothetical protein